MTVAELIKQLSKMDPELRVVVNGYEGGYDDINKIETIQLALNVNVEWYYGPHESITNDIVEYKGYPIESAIVISGERQFPV